LRIHIEKLFPPQVRVQRETILAAAFFCSEGAPEISQPHCGWNVARKSSRPERTPENFRTIPSSFQDEFILADDTSHFVAG
jgi:hypothetical protein